MMEERSRLQNIRDIIKKLQPVARRGVKVLCEEIVPVLLGAPNPELKAFGLILEAECARIKRSGRLG